jgi:hypothetical protein
MLKHSILMVILFVVACFTQSCTTGSKYEYNGSIYANKKLLSTSGKYKKTRPVNVIQTGFYDFKVMNGRYVVLISVPIMNYPYKKNTDFSNSKIWLIDGSHKLSISEICDMIRNGKTNHDYVEELTGSITGQHMNFDVDLRIQGSSAHSQVDLKVRTVEYKKFYGHNYLLVPIFILIAGPP